VSSALQLLGLYLQGLLSGWCQYASFSQSSSEVSVSPGQTVVLTCDVANVGADKANMNWIRQSPGKKPEGVVYFNTDLSFHRAPGIPDRYVPSRDSSNTKFLLTISNVQEADDSVYFCFALYSSAGSRGLGCVLGRPEPQMHLFPPAQEEITTGSATLTCLVSSFFPGYITVVWRRDGKSQEQGVHTGLVALAEDQTYLVSSYLTVPASEWGSGARYSCVITHESLVSPLEKFVSSQAC
uniref:Ig-like domain-containing protein n=1 Tax=Pelusios castaneus TaxID=367368 RepID=A0A8C8VFV7_9SAUR